MSSTRCGREDARSRTNDGESETGSPGPRPTPPEPPQPNAMRFVPLEELFAPSKSQWLVEALGMEPGPPVALLGPHGAGSVMAMAGGLAVALGKPFWGLHPVRRGRYLHVDSTLGVRQIANRLQRMVAAMGCRSDDVDGWLDVVVDPPLSLSSTDADDLLRQLLDGRALAVIDGLSGLVPRIESDADALHSSLRMLGRASERSGCVVLVVYPVEERAARHRQSEILERAVGAGWQSAFVLSRAADGIVGVEHERDRSRGADTETFSLRIVDVRIGIDARAGLSVRPPDPMHTLGRAASPSGENALDRVRECIRDNPGIAGAEAVREYVAMKASTVRAAVAQLMVMREIVSRPAPRNGVRLYLNTAASKGDAREEID